MTGYRTMYDSTRPEAIPADAGMIAGYADGDFAWPADAWDNWPLAAKVRISNTPPYDVRSCSVADIETGALRIADARPFIVARDAFRKGTATIYCDMTNLPYVGKACAGLAYNVWAAWWPALPGDAEIAAIRAQLRPGAKLVAVQYRSLAQAGYDLSLVIDPDWHRQPAKTGDLAQRPDGLRSPGRH
jgi:hypothetical protein